MKIKISALSFFAVDNTTPPRKISVKNLSIWLAVNFNSNFKGYCISTIIDKI